MKREASSAVDIQEIIAVESTITPPPKKPRTQQASNLHCVLIEKVKPFPCIWDLNSPDFGVPAKTDEAWKAITISTQAEYVEENEGTLAESNLRCVWNTSWNQGVYNFEEKHTEKPSTSIAGPKSVTWDNFYKVNCDEKIFDVPMRYKEPKPVDGQLPQLIAIDAESPFQYDVLITKIMLTDTIQVQSLIRSLQLTRVIGHQCVLRPYDVYVNKGGVYAVFPKTEMKLRDRAETIISHYSIAKIIQQVLSVLVRMQEIGAIHGDLTMDSIYVTGDSSVMISSHGECLMTTDADAFEADVRSCGLLLANMLMDEYSAIQVEKHSDISEAYIEWKPIMESEEETGLTDMAARDLLFVLLEGSQTPSDILEHYYFSSLPAIKSDRKPIGIDLAQCNILSENVNDDLIEEIRLLNLG